VERTSRLAAVATGARVVDNAGPRASRNGARACAHCALRFAAEQERPARHSTVTNELPDGNPLPESRAVTVSL